MAEAPAATGRRLALVTYEFPPSAGGGVQRVTKFAKYLRDDGWEVVVVAAEPLKSRPTDPTLLDEVADIPVVRSRALHVSTAIARLLAPLKLVMPGGGRARAPLTTGLGAGAGARRPLSGRVARWVTVPDDAVLWSGGIPRRLERLHRRTPFDVIVASGPPYSALVGAVRAGRRLGVPVVVDLRDAWKNALAGDWPMRWQERRSVNLEREVMHQAEAVVCVSRAIEAEALEMGARRTMLLPNGFDADDMPEWRPQPDAPLRLVFLGRLSPQATDPTVLFRAMAHARQLDPRFSACRLDVIGPDAPWAVSLARELGVIDQVRFAGFKPYREALEEVATADRGIVLLADSPAAKGVYSGKAFDYLGVGIPMLVFGPPDSGAAELARETGCGVVLGAGDVDAGAEALCALAEAKREGHAQCKVDPAVRARYERRAQVEALSGLLTEVVTSWRREE